MKIAIITGASSGLGRAYAQQLDRGGNVEELWLIARREERLKALSRSLFTPCRILPLDLTAPAATAHLQALLEEERPVVDTLICAAGFGKFGRAQDLTEEETASMINLNCRAAAEVTRACIPYLRRDSRVLEVASCAAFQPLQGMNLYAATKAFLLHYTRALRRELAPRGVKVTAVCPWWVKTEFMQVARNTAHPEAVAHTPFALRPEAVAAWSLTMAGRNRAVVTCGAIPALMRLGRKILPTAAAMAVWERVRKL